MQANIIESPETGLVTKVEGIFAGVGWVQILGFCQRK